MRKPTSEKELRAWLARKLGIPKIERLVWGELKDNGYVSTALDEAELFGLEELERRARRLRRLHRGAPPPRPRRRSGTIQVEELVPEIEWKQSIAISEHLGRLASKTLEVRSFRGRILEGGLLTDVQAKRLLDSRAPRYFPREWFIERGIPLIGHDSEWFDLALRSDGNEPLLQDEAKLRITWATGVLDVPLSKTFVDHLRGMGSRELAILEEPKQVLAGSVFHELRELSVELSGNYGWKETGTTMFILTGRAPSVPPILASPQGAWSRDHNHLRLRFDIEPWVSPQSVLKAFRYVQRLVHGRSGRPSSDLNLDLFNFVSRRRHETNPTPTWRKLLAEWNRAEPARRLSDPRRFERDFNRTARRLIFPAVRWPEVVQPRGADRAPSPDLAKRKHVRSPGRGSSK